MNSLNPYYCTGYKGSRTQPLLRPLVLLGLTLLLCETPAQYDRRSFFAAGSAVFLVPGRGLASSEAAEPFTLDPAAQLVRRQNSNKVLFTEGMSDQPRSGHACCACCDFMLMTCECVQF